jgi:hypothetical protein
MSRQSQFLTEVTHRYIREDSLIMHMKKILITDNVITLRSSIR